jgi:hypothetical protein
VTAVPLPPPSDAELAGLAAGDVRRRLKEYDAYADQVAETAYYERLDAEARTRRNELWLRTPDGCCSLCLHPTEPGYTLCHRCSAEEAHLDERRDL